MATSPPSDWEECFRLISQSKVGREILDRFLPEYHSGSLELREVETDSNELLGLWRGDTTGTPAGGFTYDGGNKRILLARHPALGLQAPLLFHEMVHATDEEFIRSFTESERMWRWFRERAEAAMIEAAGRLFKPENEITGGDLDPASRIELVRLRRAAENFERLRLFRTERKAYNLLYIWVQEVCERVPAYRVWLRSQRSQGFDLDRDVTDEEILRGYDLQAKS